jgi:hypothetical protein
MEIVITERPDTDAIEREQNKFYSNPDNLEYKECSICAPKPGSPILCDACHHNRRVIAELRKRAGLD